MIDWRSFNPDSAKLTATALDPLTLAPRCMLQGVDWSQSSLSWSSDSDVLSDGRLAIEGGGWSGHSMVRIELRSGSDRVALGTYFVERSSERWRGGHSTQTLDLASRMLALSGALVGADRSIGLGASAASAVSAFLAAEGIALTPTGEEADALHTSPVIYTATTTVLDAASAEASYAGCRLDVDGLGNIGMRRVYPIASRPIAWHWDADGGDPMLVGGISDRGVDETLPNSVTVRATSGTGDDEVAIWATAELDGSDERSFAVRGRHVGRGYDESGLSPFSAASAQSLALSRLTLDSAGVGRRSISSMFVPLREHDAVMLREGGVWRTWEVQEVRIDNLATLVEEITLKEAV